MSKITDATYRLPVVLALSSFDLFETGTTAPMAIWGVDTKTGERGQYVVKYKNHNRMTTTSSAFEFLGAWMAMEIGLCATKPVLVNITKEFVDTLVGRGGYKAASQSMGLNYGSQYVPGISQIPPSGFTLTKAQIAQARQLFIFDLFIQNIDRGHQKPNLGVVGDNLIVYDHELAFSFLRQLPFSRSKTPWILNPSDSELYKKHFFYRYFKDGETDFADQVDALDCFNDDFWKRVLVLLPKEFNVAEVEEIRQYLLTNLGHKADFAASIHKVMTT